jgi:hypothetical protein
MRKVWCPVVGKITVTRVAMVTWRSVATWVETATACAPIVATLPLVTPMLIRLRMPLGSAACSVAVVP